MSAEILTQPGAIPDPDLSMGRRLMDIRRRRERLSLVKVAIVWVVLLVLMVVVLLQLNFSPQYIYDHFDIVLNGLLATVLISAASIFFASLLALFGALARLSKNEILQGISGLYVSIFRGTPLLIQLFLIYNGLAQIGLRLQDWGMDSVGGLLILNALQAGVLALSLNYGAYMTEIFRAGIQSVGHGQLEAAMAIGMTRMQMLLRVVLPQAVRVIIPDIGNQFIAMQKDSALASVIGTQELSWWAYRFAKRDARFLEMLLIAAALYWLLTIVSSSLLGYLENRMSHAYER
jgi:polar amino acid transport system permease protein